MSLRFSRVTAAAAKKTAIFLVGGTPTGQNDLKPWIAYRNFIQDLPANEKIAVNVETFEYGEEEPYDATPEEVAYIYMREVRRPDFIKARTKKTGETSLFISLDI